MNDGHRAIEAWLRERSIVEVECIVPDLAGVPRGKILPTDKFIEGLAGGQHRLPKNVPRSHAHRRLPAAGRRLHRRERRRLRAGARSCDARPRALVRRAHRAGDRRLRAAGRRALALLFPPRAREPARKIRRARLAPGHRAGDRVLPGREEHRPGPAAQAAHRRVRPARGRAPGVRHRRGQRVRSLLRGPLRLLRGPGAGHRHAQPRERGRPGGDQLPPRRGAPARGSGVRLQAHRAPDSPAPRLLCDLHGETDAERAGQRHARAPVGLRGGGAPAALLGR